MGERLLDGDPPRRATLAQVADQAGVSLKTASRALGGESYVTDDTRNRVLTAAKELGYQRNAAASLLASGRLADSIGLIMGEFTNPFYSAIAQGIEDEVQGHGIHLSVANSRESADQEWRVALDLADRQTKALIVVSAMPEHSGYAQLQARGVPVIFVDRPAEQLAAESVIFDNREGGRIAARHLIDTGHSRIAMIGDYDWLPTHRERLAGLSDVLDDAGARWRDLIRTDAHDAAQASAQTAELLRLPDPPTAIVAGNNRIVLGVVDELAGRSDVAVLSFDEFEWAQVLGVTVVSGSAVQLGREAARLALARLADRGGAPARTVLPMHLIARTSTERATS